MAFDQENVVAELRQVLEEAEELVPKDTRPFASGASVSQAVSLLRSAIERFTPTDSSYRRQVSKLLQHPAAAARADTADDLIGTLSALISDYEKGRLRTYSELIHADVSADYLKQAEELARAGYKDPAVVLAGSLLEQHMRLLAEKAGISIHAGGRWKRADRLNSDLAKAGVFSRTEQKVATALLARRNEAAHGEYEGYSERDATSMLDQIQHLIAKHPA